MQQAQQYADLLGVPFSFASNGDGFVFRDATLATGVLEQKLALHEFPSPAELWARYCAWKGWNPEVQRVAGHDYAPSKTPRYYQLNAINRTVEGRTAIWRDELPTCLHQNHVFKARGLNAEWSAVWAELYLNSEAARSYFAASAKQTTNLASINMTELKNCAFPPPTPPRTSPHRRPRGPVARPVRRPAPAPDPKSNHPSCAG